MFEDRVTYVFSRLTLVSTDHPFNLKSVLLITAVVNPICVQEENISGTHERDVFQVRCVHLVRSQRHGNIFVPVGMVLGNHQTECGELRHASPADFHELLAFCGKYEWRRVTETYKAEVSTGMYLTVEHGRDFARIVILVQ